MQIYSMYTSFIVYFIFHKPYYLLSAMPTLLSAMLTLYLHVYVHVRVHEELNVVVTGSWDKTVKFWDIRQNSGTAAAVLPVGERVYAMDAKGRTIVVGTADRNVSFLASLFYLLFLL